MITYLRVKNLAIVEEFVIEPGGGLNVLTGETGAGKSLLIDSLEFISGARASSESVRTGEEKMLAEAVMQAPQELTETLAELGIEPNENGELIVRREMSANGRGRVLLNGSPVSVRDLLGVTENLLEIHGQDESRERIAGKRFIEIVDAFAGAHDLLDLTRRSFREWKKFDEELRELRAANENRVLQVDLLKYQIDEIESARLSAGEEERLREERAVLSHAQELLEATAAAYRLLDEDDLSAQEQLSRAAHALAPLAKKIEEVSRLADELNEVIGRVSEISRNLSSFADGVAPDPGRLEEIEQRLASIERLKKKYGGSVDAVLDHMERIRPEYERLSNFDESIARLEQQAHNWFARYETDATELSKRRHDAATELEAAVERELVDLAMNNTIFRILIGKRSTTTSPLMLDGVAVAFGPDGFDDVEFLIAPNTGEQPKPLQKIASGGELSRIQLAIAAAMLRDDSSAGATLVFDEIDAGVGGRVAEAVGRKLRDLARSYQVICVTHLPQIACLGSSHFRVWKEEAGGRTCARIAALTLPEERVDEIARMLAGAEITDSARAHARALLDSAVARPEAKRSRAKSAAR